VIRSCRPEEMKSLRALDALYVALGQDAGELVVPLLRTNNGGIFVEEQGNTWVSMRYVRHDSDFDWRTPTWCGEHCETAAKGLARLHAGAQPVLEMSKRVQDMLPGTPILQIGDAIEKFYRQLDQDCNSQVTSLLRKLEDLLPKQVQISVRAVQDAESHAGMFSTVAHGDFHPGNCLFIGEQLRAIIDFEYMHSGSPIFDLAYGGVMFATNWSARASDESTSQGDEHLIDRHFLKYFVGSYRSEARKFIVLAKAALINDDEHLDHYMRLAYMLVLIWCLEQAKSKNATSEDSNYLRIAEIASRCLRLNRYPV
jgi:thiamine kinase-like enzyme